MNSNVILFENFVFIFMSFFKTKWVILAIKKKEWDETIYTFFSFEYGKILIQKKKKIREKPLDLGYVIQCEVVTHDGKSIHKVKNLKIKSQFLYEQREFSTINEYLILIALIKKLTPDGVTIPEIYKVLSSLHKLKEISEEKIILWELKVLNILGLLKWENENPLIQKLLKFIDQNSVDTVYKLKWIDESLRKELKSLVVY
jgi:recombinational DNA repair protein (RecF pathway)